MNQGTYETFDLGLEENGSGYRARVWHSPAGEGTFDIPARFSPEEIEAFRQTGLTGASRDLRPLQADQITSDAPPALITLGQRLFEVAFGGEIGELLRDSLQRTRLVGQWLRIRLRVDDVPDLARVPWELLYEPRKEGFLGVGADIAVVRYLEVGQPVTPLSITPPMRLLVAAASPPPYPRLQVEREYDHIRKALRNSILDGYVEIDWLPEATPAQLRDRLRDGQPHLLHFIGHGDFDPARGGGSLLLLNEATGHGQRVDSKETLAALRLSKELRMVFLNTCWGAAASTSDAFRGIAQQIVRDGLPAAIAMQFPIGDDAAIAFSREWYRALAANTSIDVAVSQARQAIRDSLAGVAQFATPVLFTRAPDGHLFTVEQLEPAQRTQHRVAELRRELRLENDQAEVIDHLEEIVRLSPQDADAARELREINSRRESDHLLELAELDMSAGKYGEAYDKYERVFELRGNYRGVLLLQNRAQKAMSSDDAYLPALADSAPQPEVLTRAEGAPEVQASAERVLRALREGKLAIFLGTDTNLCGRPSGAAFAAGKYLPTGRDLAALLTGDDDYSGPQVGDLMRVAQYFELGTDWGTLFDRLHKVLAWEVDPTPLHRLIASLPKLMAPGGRLVVVNANLDDGLERTLTAAGTEFDVLSCVLKGGRVAGFVHKPFLEAPRAVDTPNEYLDLPSKATTGTVVVKIHGAIERGDGAADSYVITEDHHIEYSACIAQMIPLALRTLLKDKYFLFLGYDLRDWHLRVFLNAVWQRDERRRYGAWVLPREPREIDRFWASRGVQWVEASLDQYVDTLSDSAEHYLGTRTGTRTGELV